MEIPDANSLVGDKGFLNDLEEVFVGSFFGDSLFFFGSQGCVIQTRKIMIPFLDSWKLVMALSRARRWAWRKSLVSPRGR